MSAWMLVTEVIQGKKWDAACQESLCESAGSVVHVDSGAGPAGGQMHVCVCVCVPVRAHAATASVRP